MFGENAARCMVQANTRALDMSLVGRAHPELLPTRSPLTRPCQVPDVGQLGSSSDEESDGPSGEPDFEEPPAKKAKKSPKKSPKKKGKKKGKGKKKK